MFGQQAGEAEKADSVRHIFMAGMSVLFSDECSSGTFAGATAIHRPNAMSATPITGASRAPTRKTFSEKINTAITAIQKRLMTPSPHDS